VRNAVVRDFVRPNHGLSEMGVMSGSKYYNLRRLNRTQGFDEPMSPPSDD
jgi:hypothetical protein